MLNMLLGAHVSIAGGIHKSPKRAKDFSCNTFQIFTKNQRQWNVPDLSFQEITLFKKEAKEHGFNVIFSHATYLINIASPNKKQWKKSVNHMIIELHRSYQLGLKYYIIHPGFYCQANLKEGMKNITNAISLALKNSSKVMILLETTAGQGSSIGYKFWQIANLILQSAFPERIGVCVDTCHIFAAGYDIRTKQGYDETMYEFDRLIGINKLKVLHFNDSIGKLGSRVDRHQHIGRGEIGLNAFSFFINDKNFTDIPMIIETPKEEGMDFRNLDVLRSLKKT
jgi:deoxyribonuclease-4